MFIVKNRKIFFILSGLFVAISLFFIFTRGLNAGLDFTGGTSFEITYPEERPELSAIKDSLSEAGLDNVSVRPFGDDSFMFQTQRVATTTHEIIYQAIVGDTTLASSTPMLGTPDFIGPSIGEELRSKAWIAIATVVFGIILFVAYVFRHSSDKVSSWKYGIIAIIALTHDIIIPTGVAAFLGIEIGSLFVIALLAILGLSVNDTIVVFDRVRENIKLKISKNFEELVGTSLEQTFVRSINTSLTTLFVVVCLYLFGPTSTQDFALILAVGLAIGTYSSIFLASPLLVEAEKIQRKQKEAEERAQKQQ
jgi:preprotein translocase subunit SecF